MALPILKLDLAPPSNLWRLNHVALGWSALAAGTLFMAGALAFTWQAYAAAAASGRQTVSLVAKTSLTAQSERQVQAELRNLDVAKELPRWRLAEKIFTERSLPWSRLTAELERSLVPDVRLKTVQRTRSTDMKVQIKLKGEARSRAAEAAFVESLQKNVFFEQVLLEREGERQGGGVDFEYTLAAQSVPGPFIPLPKRPKYGKVPAQAQAPAKSPAMPPRAQSPQVMRPNPQGLVQPPAPFRVTPAEPPGAVALPLGAPERARQRRFDLKGGRTRSIPGRSISREEEQ